LEDQAVEVSIEQRQWLRELSMQSTADAVVALTREFAQQQPSGIWLQLTGQPADPVFVCTEDVGAMAVALMHLDFKLTAEAASHYREVVAFFAAAASRLALLCAPDLKLPPFFSRDAYLTSGSRS
jgi:hypothetical protein